MRKMNLHIGRKPFCGLIALGVIWTVFCTVPGQAQTPKVIKIGCVFPLTGPMAIFGEDNKRAVNTAVEYINEMGGIKALGGAKIEVVYGDNQMKPAVAATEAERLIEQEKVVAAFGNPPSATTLAASAVAERLKTPFLDPTSFADQLCRRGFRYFFELQPTAYYIVETQVNFLNYFNKAYGMNIKRVGIIHEDTDYGKSLSRAQRELLPKAGYEVVADVEYNAKAPDLLPRVEPEGHRPPICHPVVLLCRFPANRQNGQADWPSGSLFRCRREGLSSISESGRAARRGGFYFG